MASQSNDPRQPSAARPYKQPIVAPEDLPVDYSGFIAVVFGVFGAMFRYKVCSWLAIIFCAQSLANMRNMENDLKQISMAMIYSSYGLRVSLTIALWVEGLGIVYCLLQNQYLIDQLANSAAGYIPDMVLKGCALALYW
ncbi:hypothetical protein RD792_011608, partial [Penstemon davidsonii]